MVNFTSFICIQSLLYSLFPRFPHSFLVSSDFCCLLITFANGLFPDQYRQNVCPDLDTDGFYGDLVYKLKKIVGSNNFSAQFINIISHYKRIGLDIATDCMLGGQPNHGWQLCCPL